MHFTVTRGPAAGHDVTVNYQTRDGTARSDLHGILVSLGRALREE